MGVGEVLELRRERLLLLLHLLVEEFLLALDLIVQRVGAGLPGLLVVVLGAVDGVKRLVERPLQLRLLRPVHAGQIRERGGAVPHDVRGQRRPPHQVQVGLIAPPQRSHEPRELRPHEREAVGVVGEHVHDAREVVGGVGPVIECLLQGDALQLLKLPAGVRGFASEVEQVLGQAVDLGLGQLHPFGFVQLGLGFGHGRV